MSNTILDEIVEHKHSEVALRRELIPASVLTEQIAGSVPPRGFINALQETVASGKPAVIAEVKKAQKHFDNFEKRFTEIGKGLKKAQDSFDTAATHLTRYNSAVNRLDVAETPKSVSDPKASSLPPSSEETAADKTL